MNLQNRLSRLEAQPSAGADIKCPLCATPAQDEEKPLYDESVWCARESVGVDYKCPRCGRPRRITVQLIDRRSEVTV